MHGPLMAMGLTLESVVRKRWFALVLWLLSYVLRKRPGVWVFYPKHFRANKIQGNVLHLLQHIADAHPEIAVHIVNVSDADAQRHPAFASQMLGAVASWRAVWVLAQAEAIIIDSGVFQLGRLPFVQLWHGTGFKNVHYLDEHNGLVDRMKIRWMARKTLFAVASSYTDKLRKEQSMLARAARVTGSPRNDSLAQDQHAARQSIHRALGLHDNVQVFLYAPTFRDRSSFSGLSAKVMQRMQTHLREAGGVLLLKAHPKMRFPAIPVGCDCIHDISHTVADVQEALLAADVLISDYSGIVTDFAILNRPTIFFWPDYQQYCAQDRNFYYDLREVLPGPFISDEDGLLQAMRDTAWFGDPAYAARFRLYQRRFHAFADGESCQRVVSMLKRSLQCHR